MTTQKIILLICCSFISVQTMSAQRLIEGCIKDDKEAYIISASIHLLNSSGAIVSYTYTDDLGKYHLKTPNLGPHTLSISAMGFEQKNLVLTIENNTPSKSLDFSLTPKAIELKEVILKVTRPITIKRDTIVFDAQLFAQGNEQVLEDLLKKIPGLNVSQDGTIKVGNQEVEKVMIDGDDLFDKGYKILTKNMPADAIQKVEVIKNYSNNKHLKGIENSNKVALNLNLKEDKKSVWFGNTSLGYGLVSENRYEVIGNLMNFGKSNKFYFLTNLNNTGHDTTGDLNELIRPYRYEGTESLGDDQSANTLLAFGIDLPNLKPKRTNFNNAEFLSLNSIFTVSKKIKLKTLVLLHTDENSFLKNSFESFSIDTTTFENYEDYLGYKTTITGFGKIDLTYNIAKEITLEYTGKFNKKKEKDVSSLRFNSDFLKEKLNSNNQLIDHRLVFTNNFKESKVILFTSRYIQEKTPQNYKVNHFVFEDLFLSDANNSKQYSQNKMQFAGIEAHLLDKKNNGDLLEVKLGNEWRKDDLDTRFQLLNNENSIDFPAEYQNHLSYITNDLYLSGKYRFSFNNYTFLTQLDFHQLFNELKKTDIKESENPFFMTPKIGLDWQINNTNKLLTSLAYNTSNTTVVNMYSGYVQTGFRSFEKGLETFNQLNALNAIVNYTYGSWGDRFFANTFLVYSNNNNFYSNNSNITQNYSQSESIIVKNRELLSFSSSIDRYFKPLKSNLKIILSTTKTNFKNSVNSSDLREVKSIGLDYGFEIRSGFKGFFNYHIGSKWSQHQVKTTIDNSFMNNMTFLDMSFLFNDNFNLQLQSERYSFGNIEKENSRYYFLDLETKYIFKEHKLTFFLAANNLLNTEYFKNYRISDISVSKTEYRLLPRYVILKVDYRF